MTDETLLDDEPRGPGSRPIPNEETMDDAAFDASPDVLTSAAQGRLRTFIERLERLYEDADAVKADIREVFAELKGEGFDVAVTRAVIKRRKQDKAKLQEFEAVLDLYLACLGEV